jgi:membrane protease YdiL (CAAX protease family)
LAIFSLTGPPRYAAVSPWPPLVALVVAIVAQAGLLLLGGVIGAWIGSSDWQLMSGIPSHQRLLLAMRVFLALAQLALIAFVWWAAGFYGGARRAVLQLDGPRPGVRDVIVALAGLVFLLGSYNLLIYVVWPDQFMADVAPFLPMLKHPHWPLTALAIGIGAPLSEELLFRGFLLSSLAKWRGGYWPAAIIANAVWTTFHLGYSVAGLIEVFIGGLYISWLLWRSGSIWLPIIAHGATNIGFLLFLAIYMQM